MTLKNETLDEIKTSLENLRRRMIQLSEFFQYSFVLILKRKCLVGASRVRCGESSTPSTIIYTRWSRRYYELWCDAAMVGRPARSWALRVGHVSSKPDFSYYALVSDVLYIVAFASHHTVFHWLAEWVSYIIT